MRQTRDREPKDLGTSPDLPRPDHGALHASLTSLGLQCVICKADHHLRTASAVGGYEDSLLLWATLIFDIDSPRGSGCSWTCVAVR